jgi:undecaprenyl-diphosphatase
VGSTAFVYSASLIIFVHMWKSRMMEAIKPFLALIVTASVSVNIFKYVFRMPRPPDPLLHASGYAYPSGHVVLATAFYIGLAYVLFRWGRLSKSTASFFAAAMSIAMGLSRTYLSVHYLSDVVGGYLLAVGIVALFFGWLSRSLSHHDVPE